MQEINQRQIKNGTLTGVDFDTRLGIYNETVNYFAGERVFWNAHFYLANNDITSTTKEGDLSKAPSINPTDWRLDAFEDEDLDGGTPDLLSIMSDISFVDGGEL